MRLNIADFILQESLFSEWLAETLSNSKRGSAMFGVKIVCAVDNELGESPVWLKSRQEIIWLDLARRVLHRFNFPSNTHSARQIDVAGPLGAIVPTTTIDQVILLTPGFIGLLDLQMGAVTRAVPVEAGRENMVCNDAKTDRLGRLWFGTCERMEAEPRGAVYCLDAAHRPLLADSGFVVPNGPAFSPDGSVAYISDSIGGRILAYDVAAGPQLKNRRVFATIEKSAGLPDGLTVDSEGCVWCAHWGGACISRFSLSGKPLLSIPIPAKYVTSLTFGGPNLEELFITTAKPTDTSYTDLPAAGSLLSIRAGVSGIEEAPFNFS